VPGSISPILCLYLTSSRLRVNDSPFLNREAVDRMIRYEAAAERNLSKALDRLETLQRRRRGEALPPRLNVNVN